MPRIRDFIRLNDRIAAGRPAAANGAAANSQAPRRAKRAG
jgi:hypothetical protein